MSDSHIFLCGVVCFGLMLLGLLLTRYEFTKMSRLAVTVAPASKSKHEFADLRQSSASRAANNEYR